MILSSSIISASSDGRVANHHFGKSQNGIRRRTKVVGSYMGKLVKTFDGPPQLRRLSHQGFF